MIRLEPDGKVRILSTKELRDVEVSEFPEHEIAAYMNELIEQLNLCWSVIRNKEAQQ